MILTYEPARDEDILPIFQLNKELIDKYEDLSAINYDAVMEWVHKNIRENLAHFRRILADGVPSGYFCVTIDDFWDTAELDSLFVFAEYQNRGIGSAVLRECMDSIPFPISLYVFKKNTGAIRLYERMGFQITDEPSGSRYIMEYD